MSDEAGQIKLEEVRKLELGPDDVLVLKVANDMPMHDIAIARDELSERFPEHRIICLVGAVDLEVVRRTDGAAADG